MCYEINNIEICIAFYADNPQTSMSGKVADDKQFSYTWSNESAIMTQNCKYWIILSRWISTCISVYKQGRVCAWNYNKNNTISVLQMHDNRAENSRFCKMEKWSLAPLWLHFTVLLASFLWADTSWPSQRPSYLRPEGLLTARSLCFGNIAANGRYAQEWLESYCSISAL